MNSLSENQADIILTAMVEGKSAYQIRKQVTEMIRGMESKGIPSVKIPIQLSESELKAVETRFRATAGSIKNMDGEIKSLTISNMRLIDGVEKVATVTAKYTDHLGREATAKQTVNLATSLYDSNLEITTKKIYNQEKAVEANIRALQKLKDNATSLNNRAGDYGSKEHRNKIRELNGEMQKLNITQGMTKKQMDKVGYASKKVANDMANAYSEARNQGKASLTMVDKLKNAFSSFGVWSLVTVAYYAAVRALKSGIQSVIELDTAFVELRKVTNMTVESSKEFKKQADEVASSVARTTAEIVQATSAFARMGFAADEALGLAKWATVLTNVGDGIETVDSAASDIVSTLKGFRMEAEETEHVVDAINEVSNNYAITAGQITQAIAKSSASMSAANNTFEETIALVTGVVEVTQDAARSAAGMRTISMRLRGISEEGEDLVTLVPTLEKEFAKFKLTLKKDDNTFKSTYEILKDLSTVYEDMTDFQFADISELVSGKRQSDILNAALTNMKSVTGAYSSAMDSAGSALKEQEVYMDSIKAKIKELEQSVKILWTNLIGSDIVKNIVDALNTIVKSLSWLDEHIGFVETALVAMIIQLSFLKAEAILGVLASLKGLMVSFDGLTLSVVGSTTALKIFYGVATLGASVILAHFITNLKKAKDSSDSLDVSIRNMSVAIELLEGDFKTLASVMRDFENNPTEETFLAMTKSTDVFREAIEKMKAEIKFDEKREELERLQKELDGLNKIFKDDGLFNIKRLRSDKLEEQIKGIEKALGGVYDAEDKLKTAVEKGGTYALGEISKGIPTLIENVKVAISELEEPVVSLSNVFSVFASVFKKETEELVVETYSLNDAMYDLSQGVELSGEKMLALANDQTTVDFALNATKEEVISLARQWGLSTDTIQDNMKETTKTLIDEITIQIGAMEIQKQSLLEQKSEIDSKRKEMLGDKILNKDLFGLNLNLDLVQKTDSNLDSLKLKLDKLKSRTEVIGDLFSDKGKGDDKGEGKVEEKIKQLEAYFYQLNKIKDLEFEISILKSQENIDTDLIISKLKEQQHLLHLLNETRRQDLKDIEEKLKLNADDVDLLNEQRRLVDLINTTSLEWYVVNKDIKGLLEDQKKLLEDQNKLRQKMYEDYSVDMKNLLEATEKLLKQQNEDYKEQLEIRKDSLALAKKEADLQAELSDLSKDKSDMEEELFQLRLDGSKDNNSRILELEDKLSQKTTDINKKLEDDAYNRKVEILDSEINDIDSYLSDEVAMRKDALDKINEAFKSGNEELFGELIGWNNKYGTSIESDIVNMWSKAETALGAYQAKLGVMDFSSAINTNVGDMDFSLNDSEIEYQMELNGSKWHTAKTNAEKQTYVEKNELLAKSLSYNVDKVGGSWYNRDTGIKLYGTGGRLTEPELMIGGDVKETMITDRQMPSFLQEALRVAMPKMNIPMFSKAVSQGDSSSVVNLNFSGNIDSETRVNDIVRKVTSAMKNTSNNRGNKTISVL